MRASALVDHRLAVVLAMAFKILKLPQAVGRREELEGSELALELPVVHSNPAIFHQPWIREAALLRKVQEVVPIQGTRDALPPQDGILTQALGYPTVGIHIAEVQLTARLQEREGLAQNALLVGAQVDHAIAHDDVEASRLQAKLAQALDVAQLEVHIAVAENLRVVLLVLDSDVQLFLRHVHSDDPALRTHKLRCDVDVTAGTAAQVKDGKAIDVFGQAQTATVVL
mmetsp:Transcript_78878/g.189338  ORF Transcript_78878/g.189338 Transcript_78878/m.189338 type:complete len:227 (-) Transcript_78878:255-935(-)